MPLKKNGNYQTLLKGEGKTPNYFLFFLIKASLKEGFKSLKDAPSPPSGWTHKSVQMREVGKS